MEGLLKARSGGSSGTDRALGAGSGSGSEAPAAAEVRGSISTAHKPCGSIKEALSVESQASGRRCLK